MTSEGDARENEPDRSGSEFGPPLGEFGPPVSEFGPPVAEFGPPVAEFGPPVAEFGPPVAEFGPPASGDARSSWPLPQQPPDHPELTWRPAASPLPPSASPAPGSVTPPTGAASPASPSAPVPPNPAARFQAPTSGAESSFRAPESSAPAASSPSDTPAEAVAVPAAGKDSGAGKSWWNRPTDEGGVPKPPPPAESGLSWAEDPVAMRLALRVPAAAAPARRPRASSRWVALGTLAAVIVLVALTAIIITASRNNVDEHAEPGVSATTAALSCPATKDGKVTVGNGIGDTTSGPGAILGFQYAFYVERSGERARRFVAPDAENVSTAPTIQKGIDEQIPVGTTHCLRITELAADTFEADLTEHRPDGTTTVYRQTVGTVVRDGKVLVYSIKDRP